MGEEMPAIFKALGENRQYNQLIKKFENDVNVVYPSQYQKIFGLSRVLYDNKVR